ncbi:MAG: tetratricopeptide repeat protein [Chlorobi bacterium]|nr:tetratricopeptide repeat protein [Chlorobiota bacterium]
MKPLITSKSILKITIIILFLPLFVFPSDNDSLWNVWNDKQQADTTRLKSIEALIWGKFMNIDNDSLRLLGQKMLDLAILSGNKQEEADACFFTAVSYGREFNNSPETIEFLNRSLQLNIELGNKKKVAKDYKFIGLTMIHNYKYAEAISFLKKSLKVSEETGYEKGISDYYFYYGLLLNQLGDYNQAKKSFEKSLRILKKKNVNEYSKEWAWRTGNIGSILAKQGSYDKALEIFIRNLKIYKQKNDMANVALDYKHVGEIYVRKGDYLNSVKYFNKSLKIWERLGSTLYISSLHISFGNVYLNQGDYIHAISQFKQSIALSEEIHEKSWMAEGYKMIGMVYSELGEFAKGLEYLNKCLSLTNKTKILPAKADVLNNIGELYHKMGEYDNSIEYFQKSLAINRELGRRNAIAENFTNIADYYKTKGEYQTALDYYSRSRVIREEIGVKKGMAEIYIKISDLYLIQNNISEGILWGNKGFDMAAEIGALKLEQEASYCLYKAYKVLGNATQALKYYERYLALQDTLKTDEVSKQLQQMEYERQRLADSLTTAEDKLVTELTHRETLMKEKHTRNISIFVGLGILLMAVGLFSRVLLIRKTNKKLEEKNRLIEKEKERAKESEKAKDQFFDNVSHELRTPLTLIMGPLEEIIETTIDENHKSNLQIIRRNTLRLHGMINELLDLSKLEFGKVKIRAKEEDIVELTRRFLQSFESLASQKKINLIFKSDTETNTIWVDPEKFRKILANLLSNACKFTQPNGSVSISLTKIISHQEGGQNGVEIRVADTGIGIPKDKISFIFDRFYQVNEPDQAHQAGTGIGLALTKELVELHHGTIRVESEPDIGTTFIIFLPFGKKHLTEKEIMVEGSTGAETEIMEVLGYPDEIPVSQLGIEEELKKKNELPILLVTEDNADMRVYIKSHLKDEYQVIEAKNGEEGLRLAIEKIPDLIISDVMMPKMNGNKMTEKIKTDPRTSHIPVIILTAKASVESRIEGLETGADAYVTKPFNARELKVRVKKLIEQRTKLRNLLSKNLDSGISVSEERELSSMDRKFIKKAIAVITGHLSDVSFDAQTFASEMALSRSQLHRKIKALSNKSTSGFIRTIRLNRAAVLLKRRTDNVAQIAYETGFSSLSWFSRMFREQFGVSPAEYMK